MTNTTTYGLIEEKYYCDGECRVSYGIAVYSDSESDGSATVVDSIHNITCNKQRLSELISSCNKLQLSRIHLSDVIEDFIS